MDLENDVLGLLGHAFRRSLINTAELANTILAETGSNLKASHQDDLAQIKVESATMLDMVDELLALAWRAGIPIEQARIDLKAVLQRLHSVFQQQAAATGKSLTTHVEDTDGILIGDAVALEKSLRDAMQMVCESTHQNAIHFTLRSVGGMASISILNRSGEQQWAETTIKTAFKESINVALLMEILTWNRAARAFGGHVRILGLAEDEDAIGIEFQLPLVC